MDEKSRQCKTVGCNGVQVQRVGKYGPFLGCSEYPRCKRTFTWDSERELVCEWSLAGNDCKAPNFEVTLVRHEDKPRALLLCEECAETLHSCPTNREMNYQFGSDGWGPGH